ncbi:putative ribonuclease H protein, partial [Trifolium medium]|nr:putative ribonuclease H protein [Trifolium medium]
MSCFLLPKGLCNHMESMMSRFWWGSNMDQRKIHWVNWKKTCKQKKAGGLGFRDLQAFNTALLAKQGWRLITEPTSLVATVLKAKYFPNSQFLQAKQGHRSSFSWQSIQQASWILKKGCFWFVGNGKSINIWEDRWIHQQLGNTIWTTKPDNSNLVKVEELIDLQNNSWKEQIINQNFLPIEAAQICNIPLISSTEEDIISWQGTKDGIYTVRSGYNAILEWENTINKQHQSNNNPMDDTDWSKIWIHQQIGNTIWTTKPDNSNLVKVEDLIDLQNNSWKEQIINQNFLPIEAAHICNIPLISSKEEDIISWQRSGYNAILEWENTTNNQHQSNNNPMDDTDW